MSQHRGGGPGFSLLPFLHVLLCALFRDKNNLIIQVMCVYSPIPQSLSQLQRCSYCPPPHFGILSVCAPPPVFFLHTAHVPIGYNGSADSTVAPLRSRPRTPRATAKKEQLVPVAEISQASLAPAAARGPRPVVACGYAAPV